jgi:hypothetical protein
MLRRIFNLNKEEVTGERKKLRTEVVTLFCLESCHKARGTSVRMACLSVDNQNQDFSDTKQFLYLLSHDSRLLGDYFATEPKVSAALVPIGPCPA